MTFEGSSVAISHTGKVRSNNQDSGYAGSNLFVVADGMGGHAGGDVASAVAIQVLQDLDRPFDEPKEAEQLLAAAITETAGNLIEMVKEKPELSGMGTTVDALLMVDDYAVIAHIGDSRIYLYRDGELTQITSDHSFVQKLVDSGRITPEEARFHPRRSVLMRVLSDMDPNPEVDSIVMPTRDGDRWILCSDGLSGVVEEPQMAKVLKNSYPPGRTADVLLKHALDGGAPDNVTIVIVDVGGQHATFSTSASLVGSAANPIGIDIPAAKATRSWLQSAKKIANEPSHFEPEAEYLEELIVEDRRRARRRRITWFLSFIVVLAAIFGVLLLGYQWTQTRYFVGADEDSIVIYQGIQQNIGPITLSHKYSDSDLLLANLTDFDRQRVEATISARSLADAEAIVDRLRALLEEAK